MSLKSTLPRCILLAFAFASGFLNPLRSENVSGRKPNIILAFSDDLGWGDLGCYGHPVLKTPAIDRLAAQGCRLTSFYVCTPVCAPSRAGLMTGRDPVRYGLGFLLSANRPDWGIYHHVPLSEPSLARLLKSAGYRTCHLGKWHLSLPQFPSEPTPREWGFDHYLTREGKGKPSESLYRNLAGWTRNGELIRAGELPEWAADAYADEAIRFIDGSATQGRPFFINLWPFTPHDEVECAPEFKELYRDRTPQEQVYFGTVTQMDAAYARILEHLDRRGLADQTIVIFTSDNGPETYVPPNIRTARGSSGPWRAGKRVLYEGGIRVPGVFRWPGVTQPGSVSDVPATTLDLLPTLCAAAGVPLPMVELDGADLRRALRGEPIVRDRPLYWQYTRADLFKDRNPLLASPPLALRDGHWKLLCYPDFKTRVELYNLDIDQGEKWNVAGHYPAITQRMLDAMRTQHASRNRNVALSSAYLNPVIPLPSPKSAKK